MVAPPAISDLKFHIADFHFLESGPTQTKGRGSAVWLQDGQSGWILTHPPSPGGAKTFPIQSRSETRELTGLLKQVIQRDRREIGQRGVRCPVR